jgi:osmoprotectant transport system substrate-binding protein
MLNRVMNGKSLMGWKTLAAVALLGASCGGSKKPIIVGSKNTTAQVVLGEIVAQHLENRLGRKVERNFSLGNTQLVYQALANAQIGLYPEETGTVQAGILKESVSTDAASTLERVRNEMRRIAQLEVLDPLGIDNSWAIIVSKDVKFETLSDAERAQPGWKLGVTRDFSERSDGLASLHQYRVPLGAMPRVSDPGSLYAALSAGELTMVAGNIIDGPLARHDDWKVLRDDKKVFPFYQTCLMVRADLLLNDPKIRPALAELSGKITNEIMRKLDAEVDVDHKNPADLAAGFLAQAGLK